MSDRYGSYPPDDEPIIGETYPGTSQSPARGVFPGAPARPYDDEEYADDEAYDDGYDEYADDEGYYDDDYYEETPARQPLFYLFIGLAALVGGVIIFLLFSLVNSGGDGASPAGTKAATQFKVRVDSPLDGSRIQIGKSEDVVVQATSTQPIVRFELFVNDAVVDSQGVSGQPADNTYRATLKLPPFTKRGTYKAFVRVTTSTNEHSDSDKISLVAIEPVDAPPQQIKGKVIATVNVRKGPGDSFELVKTLDTGQDVTIIGKTRDGSWLLLDIEGGTWVKSAAIDPQDSIALVPVREPTPVPVPTPTTGPSPSPSPSATPTGKLPDFFPQNAQLTDGGTKLRVSIANQSTSGYAGPLVVSVTGVTDTPLKLVFQVDIAANGSATVTFDVNPAVTTAKSATIKVDPDNAIKETNKDNNSITIGLTPPVEAPVLSIVNLNPGGATITLTVRNTGGALASSTVRVKVTITVGSETRAAESSQTVALAKGQDVPFSIAKPGSGTGTVEVFLGTNPTAAASVPITVP